MQEFRSEEVTVQEALSMINETKDPIENKEVNLRMNVETVAENKIERNNG